MGTNYYRIPTEEEMLSKKRQLLYDIENLELTPSNIERNFRLEKKDSWDVESPWDVFLDSINVHLGKRSSGWKFCWNFHDGKYYSNKEELLKYIRSGRVVDEYGDEKDVEEFIKMALEWGEPDGKIVDEKYRLEQRNQGIGDFFLDRMYDDKIIDGLRVSSAIDFS
jgi:hypothetical protein